MRTFGKLSYDAEARKWCLECEPQVTMRLKRVFAKLHTYSSGEHRLNDSAENCRDLEWFLDRYPLEITTATRERLTRGASEHRELASITERLLAGRVPAKPVDLALHLRDYQLQFVEMMRHLKRILLADELGTGKTASGIGVFTLPDALPALVVTLTSLPSQWEQEIHRFAPHLRTHILKSTTPYPLGGASCGEQMALPEATPDVIITSYSKIAKWGDTLAGVVRTVLLDECQELRLGGSQKYQGAARVAFEADRVAGLSATPIYNKGSEFWHVMNVIKPDGLGEYDEFIREWCKSEGVNGAYLSDPKAFGMYTRDAGLMLRRTRKDIGREIPPIQRIPHTVGADLEVLDEVSASCRELALFLVGKGLPPDRLRGSEEAKAKGMHLLASEELSMKLRQATGIAKAPYVADFVRMVVESGEKVLLGGWHRAVYDIWLDRLKDLDVVMYTGSESPKAKDEAKARFVDGTAQVMIMSLRSGAGLDGLQKCCRTVVKGELDWSYGVHEQFEGRVARDGQEDPVVVYYLTADCGSDPIVMDVLGVKRHQLEGIVDPTKPLAERLQTDPDRIRKLAEAYLAQQRKPHAA